MNRIQFSGAYNGDYTDMCALTVATVIPSVSQQLDVGNMREATVALVVTDATVEDTLAHVVALRLQGSIDEGVNWFNVYSFDTAPAYAFVVGRFRQLRIRVDDLTGIVGTHALTVQYLGFRR